MGDTLTEDIIYDAADVMKESTPFDQIQFFAISVQHFKDISIITKMSKLSIVQFRLCNFHEFPKEFFEMPNIESIDLSGNSITLFDADAKWENMQNLHTLNLSENNISDLNEVMKLAKIPNLQHLILSGNICLSVNNAFNRVAQMFPQIDVLNDLIITSQHRGFLLDIAKYITDSTVPLTKTDDYIFLYVKYMHVSANERYVRRLHAQFFCLHRVLRRHSYALKIQSIFRGFRERVKWKKMRRSAIFLESYIRYWLIKRNRAAMKIQGAYRYYKLRRVIIEYRNSRKIQSAWRKFLSRDDALISLFETAPNVYKVYINDEALTNLKAFLRDENYNLLPEAKENNEFKLIRYGPLKKRKLPGSPVVYYNVDENILIRRNYHRNEKNPNSIWCEHDHGLSSVVEQVSNKGVNFKNNCPYSVVKFIPYTNEIEPKCKAKIYPTLKVVTFVDRIAFRKFVKLISFKLPKDVVLFPYMTLNEASAQFTMHCSVRMFIQRNRNFLEMKKFVIQKRSAKCIRAFLRTSRIRRFTVHISNMLHYSDIIPESMAFFVTQRFLGSINQTPIKFKCEFGFNSDRVVSLSPTNPDPFLANFIPTETLVYKGHELLSLVKTETMIRPALPSMFSMPITKKTIKLGSIKRVTFTSPEESFRRLFIYAFMTGDFSKFMTDVQVVEYCAAILIQNHWRAHILRRVYRHLGAQGGRNVNPIILLKQQDHSISKQKIDETPQTFKKFMRAEIPPVVAIANLRGDYRPWEAIHGYKADPKSEYEPQPLPPMYSEEIEIVPTESMRNMGLVNDLKNAYVNLSPKKKAETTTRQKPQPSSTVTELKKLPKFQIELETQSIFAPPLAKLKGLDPNTKISPLPRPVEPIKQIDRSESAFAQPPLSLPKRSLVKDDTYKLPPSLLYKKISEQKVGEELFDSLQFEDAEFDSPNGSQTDSPHGSIGSQTRQESIPSQSDKRPYTSHQQNQLNQQQQQHQQQHQLPLQQRIEKDNDDEQLFQKSESFRMKKSKTMIEHSKGRVIKSNTASAAAISEILSHQRDGDQPLNPTPSTTEKNLPEVPAICASDVLEAFGPVTPNKGKKKKKKDKQRLQNLQAAQTLAKPRPETSLAPASVTTNKPKNIEPLPKRPSTRANSNVKVPKPLIELSKNENTPAKPVSAKKEPPIRIPTPKLQTTHYHPSQMQNAEFSETLIISTDSASSTKRPAKQKQSTNLYTSAIKRDLLTEPTKELIETSPQWTDSTFKNSLLCAFTKLVRLHQLGIEIEQAIITDNTYAEKRMNALNARTREILVRNDLKSQKEQELADLIDRNKIEQFEREESAKQVRAKTALTKNRNATKVRTQHTEAIQKYNKERSFALNFVSVSRKVAQQVEQRHLKAEKRKQLEDAASSVYKARSESKESKEKFKQRVREMDEGKRKIAQRDRALTEEKRSIQKEAYENRMEWITAVKENAKAIKEVYREIKSQKKVVLSNMPPPLETDEIEGASICVGEYLGGSLGEVEAHLLCEIISYIV